MWHELLNFAIFFMVCSLHILYVPYMYSVFYRVNTTVYCPSMSSGKLSDSHLSSWDSWRSCLLLFSLISNSPIAIGS